MGKEKSRKPDIRVFVTKKARFRARIKWSTGEPPIEITVGGKRWYSPELDEVTKSKILVKCHLIRVKLESVLDNINEV